MSLFSIEFGQAFGKMAGTERTQKHWLAPLEIPSFCIILSIVEFLTGFADTAILVVLLIAGRGWAESQLEFGDK